MTPRNLLSHAAEFFAHGRLRSFRTRISVEIAQMADSAQLFLLPDGGSLGIDDAIEFLPKPVRLPYPVTAIEYVRFGTPVVALFREDSPHEIVATVMFKREGTWTAGLFQYCIPAMRYMADEFVLPDGVAVCSAERPREHLLLAACSSLYELLAALTSESVVVDVLAAPAALQAKRKKRGKTRLFDYHVLKLGATGRALVDFGGTHASPRLHRVRGYWRRSPRLKFVEHYLRGSANRGLLQKDYDARPLA